MSKKYNQAIPPERKYTVNDFNREFPDDDACFSFLSESRWPKGFAHCEKCDRRRKHHRVHGRTALACDHCGNHIYPLAGTIFEKTTTPLRLWFHAMFLIASTRCGISAKQLQREVGVTYKTAWRMFKQIRQLMAEPEIKLGGGQGVEVDEMYFGGKRKGGTGRPMRGDKIKTPVLGMVERKGKVIVRTVDDTTAKTLCGNIREFVLPATTIFTDELPAYNTASKGRRYTHKRINHSAKVYVRGDVHTNTIEGVWSLIKRGIGGVYHQVSQKYLQSYLDEYAFRYNRREMDQPMFTSLLRQLAPEDVAASVMLPCVEASEIPLA